MFGIKTLSALLVVIFFSQVSVAEDIRINKVADEKEELLLSVLELVWSKADPNGKIIQLNDELPVSRLPVEVESGAIDLMWAGASAKNDEQMLAVRIPLLKGMLGHRISIIRQGDQHKFNDIRSISDLARLDAGMGRTWGSTKVLEQAGLNVVTAMKYENLFHMLEGGRFDYFPRGIHEPWADLAKYPELPLEVEKRILLIYPYAMYFYLQKDNRALHAKLTRGFEQAIADGSFDELFYSAPMVKQVIEKGNIKDRIVLRMPNNEMHKDTPVDRPELWLDVNKL
ncbi:transporter substrate-binding domain-containing protein [Saccharophagus degradans]|uniref:Transporter substrate-binding domain-containing protein n=1 Tax=Saccharophagus degradans TaxID=86304 RepID=A0AAW7X1N2_9GAMM|nr:transporter substrate-binding domain-containing protein [Saccharophagus degradans]MDO6421360.1 transporter substrate-binding domain-containing protein [Saccharophagus degradans]MDO6609557.1 transporter substrate-binding domain-containing protein [Saccharophagus degradans]